MKWLIVFWCLFLASLSFYLASTAADDTGNRLLESAGKHVFVLAIPSRHRAGGTGFVVRAPSGARYTITNGHVCDVAEGGQLAAQVSPGRYATVQVIEQSEIDDLCITTAVPGTTGALELGSEMPTHLYVVGHPYLNPNTLAEGRIVGRFPITMPEPNRQPCDIGTWHVVQVPGYFGTPDSICVRTLDSVQTSAVIYPGNSGSPAMDAGGRVIGVMFAGDNNTHYGSMVPLDRLREFLSKY